VDDHEAQVVEAPGVDARHTLTLWTNSQALKLRKHLLKQVEKLQAESTSGVDISQFEIIEGLLEKYAQYHQLPAFVLHR
jgi:NADH dehydrogenase FAD-containing subunit